MGQECVGAIVCKLDMHKKMFRRGYIAMLAVDSKHRRKSIGELLFCLAQNKLFLFICWNRVHVAQQHIFILWLSNPFMQIEGLIC